MKQGRDSKNQEYHLQVAEWLLDWGGAICASLLVLAMLWDF